MEQTLCRIGWQNPDQLSHWYKQFYRPGKFVWRLSRGEQSQEHMTGDSTWDTADLLLLTRGQSEKALSASALSVCFVATFYWDKILNSKWETEESSVQLYSSGQSGVASDMRVTSHWTADCPAGSALAADPAPTADCPASVLCCDVSDGFLETIKIRKWRN